MKRWQHDQIHIERLHKHDPAGNDAKLMRTFLDSLEQQNRERTEETSDHQEHAQRPPRRGIPNQIVLRCFWNIGVPIQHVLAETDVGPENGEARIAIMILSHRKAAQKKCDASEENEIKKGTEKEKRPVQILTFAIEHWILAWRDIHPLKEMMAEQQNRDRKNKECEEEERDVFELPAHYDRPFGIGGMMHNRPKQTAAAKGEKIKEAEQPGETELRLIL